MPRRTAALTAAALSLLPLGQPLLLGTLGITAATTAVVLHQGGAIAQDASAVARIAKAITVRIEGSTQGSGVIVKQEGNRYTVLTAWHVVSGNRPGEEVGIYTPDGKEHQLEQGSIQRLGQVDMAVLTFSSPGAYEVAPVGDVKSVSMGNQIFVSGFPLESSAVPSRLMRFLKGDVVANATVAIPDGYQLLYSNQTLPGMSGGSVLNSQGQLVGIHGRSERDDQVSMSSGKAVSTGTNQAVPISYYRQFNTGQTVVVADTQATSADDYLAQAKSLLDRVNQNSGLDEKAIGAQFIALANKSLTLKQSAEGYRYRGIGASLLKDYQGAIADYNKAIAINPRDANAYNNRGNPKKGLKDYQGAIADFSKAIAIDPQSVAYANRGTIKGILKDYQGAIADFNKAIAIDPQNLRSYLLRGILKSSLKDYQGAIVDLNKAIQINSRFAGSYHAYYERGTAKGNLGDYQGAIADYSKEITINPNYAFAYAGRGSSKYFLKDLQGAIYDYNKAIQIDPQIPYAYGGRGIAKSDLKDYQGAIADYDKAIAINPQDADVYNNRGNAKFSLSDKKGACADYKKAVSLGHQLTAQWLNSEGGAWCRNMR